MIEERWIKTEESNVWVSSFGRFRREPFKTYLNGKERWNKEKIIEKFYLNRKGYCVINLKGKRHFVHRLVAKYFVLNKEEKAQVNHIDGNKLNNHVSNLEWVTNQENRNHAVSMGLIATGERANSIVSTETKIEIINKILEGKTQAELSKQYNLRHQTVSLIWNYYLKGIGVFRYLDTKPRATRTFQIKLRVV